MATKTINLGRRTEKPAQPSADAWVAQGAETTNKSLEAKGAVKRISVDISLELHRKLMIYCVTNDTKITEVVRGLIERELADK